MTIQHPPYKYFSFWREVLNVIEGFMGNKSFEFLILIIMVTVITSRTQATSGADPWRHVMVGLCPSFQASLEFRVTKNDLFD